MATRPGEEKSRAATPALRPHRRRWISLLAGVVSLAATLVLWKALQRQEYTETDQFIRVATQALKADLTGDIQARMLGLYAMVEPAEYWGMAPSTERDSYTQRYLAQYRSCRAIVGFDPSLKVRWVVTAPGPRAPDVDFASLISPQRAAFDAARDGRDVLLSHPFQVPEGKTLVAVIAPVYEHDKFEGFITGFFNIRQSMEDMIADRPGLGYGLAVRDGSQQLYRSSESESDNARQWTHEAAVELPGATLQLRVWPTPETLASDQRLSHALLMNGLMMSFLLALTVHLAQQARGRAKALEFTNRELQTEIAERKRAEESLRRLSGTLLDLQDEERRVIAQQLHDTTAQTMFAVSMKLGLLRKLVSRESAEAQALLSEGAELTESGLRELRTLFYLLHPPSFRDIGLIATLDPYVKAFAQRHGMKISLDIPAELDHVPKDIEPALFRTVQESLNEIHRHSGASSGSIRIGEDQDKLIIEVNGVTRSAVDLAQCPCPGLAAVRERLRQLGGTLETASVHETVTVRAILPLATQDR